jgi:transketolase
MNARRFADTKELATRIRRHALRMTHKARASHIGSGLSMADILAVIYGEVLRNDPLDPTNHERDRLVVSKGHAAAIVYAVLAEADFIPVDWLDGYCEDNSRLAGHVTHRNVPGVELSTGSLGHGLPVGAGMALAAKRDGRNSRVYVILSDGEMDEGSNWEAIQFAQQFKLDNLVAIVDYNKIQSFGRVSEVSELEPFADKWRAFNWGVREIDGHDHAVLSETFASLPFTAGQPNVVIAHTVKGKGVSFMEDKLAWHYKSANAEELALALAELDAAQ